MKHLRIKTDNLVWAICLSGAAISASKNVANPAFNLVIESDVPEIKFLASAFSTKTPGVQYTDIVIPTDEKELAQLDIAGTRKLERELRVLHGIDVTEEVNVLTLLDLSTIVLDQYGIKSQAKTFYPKLSKPQYEKYQEYDCVITKSEYLKWAQEYARGYGREFNILDATNLPVSEVIKAINNPGLKLLVAHASDPILFVAKSYYKDYDNIAQTFCTLIMYEPEFRFDRFCCPLWGACLPQNTEDPVAENKGKLRKVQEICHFDNHVYKKKKATGEIDIIISS